MTVSDEYRVRAADFRAQDERDACIKLYYASSPSIAEGPLTRRLQDLELRRRRESKADTCSIRHTRHSDRLGNCHYPFLLQAWPVTLSLHVAAQFAPVSMSCDGRVKRTFQQLNDSIEFVHLNRG